MNYGNQLKNLAEYSVDKKSPRLCQTTGNTNQANIDSIYGSKCDDLAQASKNSSLTISPLRQSQVKYQENVMIHDSNPFAGMDPNDDK